MDNIEKNLISAITYYNAMLSKDFDSMSNYIDQDICLVSPFGKTQGREEVIEAAKHFAEMIQDIQIRSKFTNDNQVVLIYDAISSNPIGTIKAAALMNFSDHNKITKIELFYDARPFELDRK